MGTKFLIDLPHPHFVHFFKNLIPSLGISNVVLTCQKSGIITTLLDNYDFKYIIIGKKYHSMLMKAFGQVEYFVKYIYIIRKHRIDFLLGMSPSLALAGRILGKKVFFFDDDDSAVQPFTKRLTAPLSNVIITPRCLHFENYGAKHIMYKGYQELAYLAPEYFKLDRPVLERYGLVPKQYSIVRFNEFVAHHDIGHSGMTTQSKYRLIELLQQYGDVFITAEGSLVEQFRKYQLRIDPRDIHQVLAGARIYVGDSQTMASEAAVLGTPAIRCNTFKDKISYLRELEKEYQLTFAFFPQEEEQMLQKVKTLMEDPYLEKTWKRRRESMLSEMEDVNHFVLKVLKESIE